jgi:hypothetical protein
MTRAPSWSMSSSVCPSLDKLSTTPGAASFFAQGRAQEKASCYNSTIGKKTKREEALMDEQAWQAKSIEILTEIKAWRQAHSNPMLALRLAVCNDRWQEMWHKARGQQHIVQALQRSEQTEPQIQVSLADGCCTQTSSPPLFAAASMPRALPTALQRRSAATPRSPTSTPPVLTTFSSCQDSSPLTCQSVNTLPQQSDLCPCGAPLVRFKGHRTKEYCSDHCRQRAYRQRQAMKRWE